MALVTRKPIDENATSLQKRPKVGKRKDKRSEFGRLYVIKLVLKDGTEVHKIGMCNSDRSTDRMMEILRSFFMVYRYVPYAELRRDKKVRIPYIVESYIHRLLKEYRYKFDKKFNGNSEAFEIDEDSFLEYLDSFRYEEMLEGETKMDTDRYNKIKRAIQLDKDPDTFSEDMPIPF